MPFDGSGLILGVLAQVASSDPSLTAALAALLAALATLATALASWLRGRSISAAIDENTALTKNMPATLIARLDANDKAHGEVLSELGNIKTQLESVEDRLETLEDTRPTRWLLVGTAVLSGAIMAVAMNGWRKVLSRYE